MIKTKNVWELNLPPLPKATVSIAEQLVGGKVGGGYFLSTYCFGLSYQDREAEEYVNDVMYSLGLPFEFDVSNM